jgi:hypothetical protein
MGGSVYVGRILMGMGAKSAGKVPEVELKPIVPGAWAAWAKTSDTQTAGGATQKATSTATPAKGTLSAAKG